MKHIIEMIKSVKIETCPAKYRYRYKIIRVFTSKFPNRCLYFLFNIISIIIPIKLKIDTIIERKFLTVTKYTIHDA